MKKILTAGLAALVLVLALQGACFAAEAPNDAKAPLVEAAEELLQKIETGDVGAVRALFTDEAAELVTDEVVQQLNEYFNGQVESAEVTDISIDTTNSADTGTQIIKRSATIKVVTDADEYIVAIQQEQKNGGAWKTGTFNIVSAADYAAATAVDEARTAVPQGIMIAVTIAFYAVIAWAVVWCIRAKIKLKWLWIIVIALLTIAVTVSGNGTNVNTNVQFGVYIATFSNAIYLMNGAYQLRVVFPVGAILFLALKKMLEKNYAKAQQRQLGEMRAAAQAMEAPDDGAGTEPQKEEDRSEGLK